MTQAPSEGQPTPPLFVVASLGALATGLLFVSVGLVTQVLNIGFGLWFAEVFLFFGIPFLALRISGYDAFRTAGVSRPWLAGAAFGFLVGAVNFFAVVIPIQFVSQKLAPKELVEVFDISGIFRHQTPIELAAVVLGVSIAAPFCEEFCFRGLLQRGIATRVGGGRALVLTAVIFSAFHMDPVGFLARFELGLVFGLLALRSGSIWPGVFAHLANNAISTGLYFASRDSPGAEEDLQGWVPLAMAGAGIPLLFAVGQLTNRWPAMLTPPWRAEERLQPAQVPALLTRWSIAGLAAIALLLTVDPNGVRLNLFDIRKPLKAPKKTEGEVAQRQWDELWRLREEARAGRVKLGVYEAAREEALAARGANAGVDGPLDAGTPPQL